MGRLHADKLAALAREGVLAFAGVYDVDVARAGEIAGKHGAPVLETLERVARAADAACVAVPTVEHARVAGWLLDAGLDVLVEKPIATSRADARSLIERARARGRILQVGHIERFSRAFRAIRPALSRPRFIEAHRIGPYPARATDVSVVLDLMIHDLDIVAELAGHEVATRRRRRRAGALEDRGHRERAAAPRERLRRQPDREPRLARAPAQGAAVPERRVRVDRPGREQDHDRAPRGRAGRRGAAAHHRREARARRGRRAARAGPRVRGVGAHARGARGLGRGRLPRARPGAAHPGSRSSRSTSTPRACRVEGVPVDRRRVGRHARGGAGRGAAQARARARRLRTRRHAPSRPSASGRSCRSPSSRSRGWSRCWAARRACSAPTRGCVARSPRRRARTWRSSSTRPT